MKKLLLTAVAIAALTIGADVMAESISGKVVATDGNQVTVRQKDGTKTTLQATPQTTYRTIKVSKHHKKKGAHQAMKEGGTYQPMVEEDDWVDIIYSPSTDSVYVIEDVIIYDD